jgi:hypothetical protein
MATRVLGVGARVSVPVLGSTVSSQEGHASVAATLFGVEATAVVLDAHYVRLSAYAGLAAAWLRTSGFASAPYVGQSDAAVTALPFLGVEVAPRLADRVHLHLAGDVGASLPRADVSFAGHTVASWGRPLGMGSAGVSVDF